MRGHAIDSNSPLPRYYQIYSAVLAMIEAGELASGQVLPAERQLADSFGVARSTVVKALDLLEREGRLEKQQGRGNIVISPVKAPVKHKTIAFVAAPPITHTLITGMSQTAFERGYTLQILGVDYDYEGLETYLTASVTSGVKGFLIYGRCEAGDVTLYKGLLARGVPVVMVDRYAPALDCDHVIYDNEAASYKLTRSLLARGHQTIAVLPGPDLNTTAVKDRLRGYHRALGEAGIKANEDLVWLDLYHQRLARGDFKNGADKPRWERGYQTSLREKLALYQPTAVFTINDLIAGQLVYDLLQLRSASSLNYSSPGHSSLLAPASPGPGAPDRFDLELATFSADVSVTFPYPTALAVHPAADLGRAAAELLIKRVDGALTGRSQYQVIPMDIADVKVRQVV